MNAVRNRRHAFRGLLAISMVYFYFLEFSQFSLLQLLSARVPSPSRIKTVLAVMAVAGIAGSVMAIRIRLAGKSWQVFVPAFLVCAAVALLTPEVHGMPMFLVMAVFMGLAIGMLTVTTAALLPAMTGPGHRGLLTGLGTGLAYAACNIPVLFNASAEARAWTAGIVVLAGAPVFLPWALGGEPQPDFSGPERADRRPQAGWVWLVLAFLILIWLDSAAFTIIQKIRSLKSASWGADPQLYGVALFHFTGALLAGLFLDKGYRLLPIILAWTGLAAGALGLRLTGWPAFAFPYVVGVSLYSCALVYFPSLGADEPGDIPSFVRAAAVYAMGGWIGSGLGIGMAEHMDGIPVAFVAVSGIMLLFVVKILPSSK